VLVTIEYYETRFERAGIRSACSRGAIGSLASRSRSAPNRRCGCSAHSTMWRRRRRATRLVSHRSLPRRHVQHARIADVSRRAPRASARRAFDDIEPRPRRQFVIAAFVRAPVAKSDTAHRGSAPRADPWCHSIDERLARERTGRAPWLGHGWETAMNLSRDGHVSVARALLHRPRPLPEIFTMIRMQHVCSLVLVAALSATATAHAQSGGAVFVPPAGGPRVVVVVDPRGRGRPVAVPPGAPPRQPWSSDHRRPSRIAVPPPPRPPGGAVFVNPGRARPPLPPMPMQPQYPGPAARWSSRLVRRRSPRCHPRRSSSDRWHQDAHFPARPASPWPRRPCAWMRRSVLPRAGFHLDPWIQSLERQHVLLGAGALGGSAAAGRGVDRAAMDPARWLFGLLPGLLEHAAIRTEHPAELR